MQSESQERPYRHLFEINPDAIFLTEMDTGVVVAANPAACGMYGFSRDQFIGLSTAGFMPPSSDAQFNEWLQTVAVGDVVQATAVHLHQNQTPIVVNLHSSGCLFQGRPCLLTTVRSASPEANSWQQEQTALLHTSQTLAATLEPHPNFILDQLQTVVNATHAVLIIFTDGALVAQAVHGPQQLHEAMPLLLQPEDSAAALAVCHQTRPQRITNIWRKDDPSAQQLRALLKGKAEVLLADMTTWMWVPLRFEDEVIGCWGMGRPDENAFTLHQTELALAAATQAAISLVNAHRYLQAQASAMLEERQRLAQNLHDAVNQSLFSANLIAEVLPRLWQRNPKDGQQSLEDLRRLTRGAMAKMRGLLAELRPLVLIDSDLGDLLRQLGDALTGRTDIPVYLTVPEGITLPAEVQVAFYRLCQEALINIAKHAGASQVTITLEDNGRSVTLHIEDNGCGFYPDQIPTGHYGLSIMRERATAIDATISVISQPNFGTEIDICWVKNQARQAL